MATVTHRLTVDQNLTIDQRSFTANDTVILTLGGNSDVTLDSMRATFFVTANADATQDNTINRH